MELCKGNSLFRLFHGGTATARNVVINNEGPVTWSFFRGGGGTYQTPC
jgi:hypothetical protein